MTENIEQAIVDLLAFGLEKGYIAPLDKILKQNQLLDLLGKASLKLDLTTSYPLPEAKSLLPLFLDFAVATELIDDSVVDRAIFSAKVMAIITPDPSVLNREFWLRYQTNPTDATQYFYDLSRDNDYIQTEASAKNIAFDSHSVYGNLEVTINLSKPEKDPKAIAAALMAEDSTYPLCQLCLENEGYAGTLTHPARANHRIVRFPMLGETWGLQYSPYAYYEEHCIFLASEHRPMQIEKKTFENLFGIVEQFPHYFVGSNADLPIVGGSILSHDHYQGGRHTFAMEEAPILFDFDLVGFENVSFGIVKWPMSVIRIQSNDKEALTEAAVHILEKWRGYSDESVGIKAFTDGTPHNTVTPIARRQGEAFICDIVLRNNRTSAEYPDGIFHPHLDVQHIKKENIGLIEVMGLAILPPRLKDELIEVEKYLADQPNEIAGVHQQWADTIVVTDDDYSGAVEKAVGQVFQRVLEDAGVYKMTDQGVSAFKRFVASL